MSRDQADDSAFFSDSAALRGRATELESGAIQLQGLFSVSEDLIMVIDEQGRYLEFAPTLSPVAAFGKQALGKTMHDFLPADVADSYLVLIGQALSTRRLVKAEYSLPTATGEPIWFRAMITPVSDTAVLWVARDVTKEHRLSDVEAELQHFKALAENTPEGVSLARADGTIFYANPAFRAMTGHGDDLLGKSILALYEEPDDELSAAMQEALEHGVWQGMLGLKTPADAIMPCQVFVVALAGSDGDIKVLASTIRDLTPLRMAEQERLDLQAQVIEAQQLSLRELSTPLMPLADGVVAMPLIGTIDHVRAQQVMEKLLEGITSLQAKAAILDITGVKGVDAQVADALLKVARAASLLGAQVILTGIGPDIAQSLVHLDADLSGIVTLGTLQSGISYALKHR